MKIIALTLTLTACVVHVRTPFRRPPPGPDSGLAPPGPSQPFEAAPARAGSPESDATPRRQEVATSYDRLHETIVRADQESAARSHDDARRSYELAMEQADQLLGEIDRQPAASAIYSTRSDGPLDQAALSAKLREQRARAERLAKVEQQRSIAALQAELHTRTTEQRALIAERGRPKVERRRGKACWIYPDGDAEEAFCWTGSGRLASHAKAEVAAARSKAPKTRPAGYYAAATFASGDCDNECSTDGWSASIPGGGTARSECNSDDCVHDGWVTRYSDGSSARTECRSDDCMTDGWSTQFSDGTSGSTDCSSDDCVKNGWTTRLPSGGSVGCECDGECFTHEASCR